MPLDPERRLSLRGATLRALISDAIGEPASDLESDGNQCFDGTRLWVLADEDDPERALGSAVFRSVRFGEAPMTVCFDDREAAAEATRRAAPPPPAPIQILQLYHPHLLSILRLLLLGPM